MSEAGAPPSDIGEHVRLAYPIARDLEQPAGLLCRRECVGGALFQTVGEILRIVGFGLPGDVARCLGEIESVAVVAMGNGETAQVRLGCVQIAVRACLRNCVGKLPRGTQLGRRLDRVSLVRVTTLCKRLLDLDGINVTAVDFSGNDLACEVVLRRRRLACPRCEFTTGTRYDPRTVASRCRGLDLGRRKVTVRARLRRLTCPTHGVLTEGVPFARSASRFTLDFEDLVAYLATKTDKATITGLLRIDWDTVGRICERVVADGPPHDPHSCREPHFLYFRLFFHLCR